MTEAVEKLLPALAALDQEDRDYVKHYLDELDDAVTDDEDPEFVAEINRRVEAIRNGTAKMIPADEVFRKADEMLKSMRENRG